MKPALTLLTTMLLAPVAALYAAETPAKKPNVLLIVCDDLNSYIEGFGGHPQTKTPNLTRLRDSGVSFQQAHCTSPICAPSRASFLTGLYPHTSRNYGFDKWSDNEVLQNSRTLMDHFRANGYHTLGTGKLMHQEVTKEWSEWGNDVDYGPFAFDGKENVAHPDVPAPLRNDFGAVDRGVPSPGLVGVWNQRQRGLAFAHYLASALADPRFVGVNWFQWLDQSAAGRPDRENHAVGFLDVTGRAHREFVETVSKANSRLYEARTSKQASVEKTLESLLQPPTTP